VESKDAARQRKTMCVRARALGCALLQARLWLGFMRGAGVCSEEKMAEALIRKCPKCGCAFTKSEGCNKVSLGVGQEEQSKQQEGKGGEAYTKGHANKGLVLAGLQMACRCGTLSCYHCRQTIPATVRRTLHAQW
jgi:hypothetical protein